LEANRLAADPYNIIITGVGGQGNVLASKVLGNILIAKGLRVTVGETFGASQRGGSVMSHLRISATTTWSPQIPRGRAHMVIALEPTEALRVLAAYGNPGTDVIVNTRPIYPADVICGAQSYPQSDQIQQWLHTFSRRCWLIPATEQALNLGAPIFANIVMIGALAGAGVLPFGRADFETVVARSLPAGSLAVNLAAFDAGQKMVNGAGG
jgi:indolepyruvate ferredoxin oxidoreductase beta subunit